MVTMVTMVSNTAKYWTESLFIRPTPIFVIVSARIIYAVWHAQLTAASSYGITTFQQ